MAVAKSSAGSDYSAKIPPVPAKHPVARRLRRKLGTCKDVPEFQRRPYILAGYRLNTRGCTQCIRSLASLHNETVNIWTHVLGLLFVAYRGSCLYVAPEAYVGDALFFQGLSVENTLVAALYLVTCNCLFASALYHTRHCDVERVCYACFHADLVGIVLVGATTLVMGVTLGFRCFPATRIFYFVFAFFEALAMACFIFLERLSHQTRAVSLTVCGLLSLIPALHFFAVGNRVEVGFICLHVAAMLACYLSGVFVYSQRIPEVWWPGAFDYAGQSHNIWHVCVFAGMYVWLRAMEGLIALQTSSSC